MENDGNSEVSETNSIEIVPSKASTIRKKAKEKEDFPLPVLPQMPTYGIDINKSIFLAITHA